MSVVETLPAHLSCLGRLARALTGSQAVGGSCALAALEAALAYWVGMDEVPVPGILPHSLLLDLATAAWAGCRAG